MLTFFFPYRPASGVSSLFGRLAVALAQQADRPVRIVDFPDGALSGMVGRDSPVQKLAFDRRAAIEVREGETLVLQAEMPSKLRRQLKIHPAAKIIEWQLHPYNFIPPLFPLIGHRQLGLKPRQYCTALHTLRPAACRSTVEFIRLADVKRGLFFQDLPGVRTTEEYLGCRVLSPIILPVPVPVPQARRRTQRIDPLALHVAWIGRLYDFKIHILLHVIRRLRAMAGSRRRVVFHVVGSGPEAPRLVGAASPGSGWELIHHGDLAKERLEELLLQRIDLVTAMGTAALEAAALGLPVVLLDLSYREVPPDYQFRWLFEAQGFEVGHTISAEDCDPNADSLPLMLAAFESDFQGVSEKCFRYVRENHSLDAIVARFLQLEQASELRYGDVPAGLWRKSWVRQGYEWLRY